MQLPENIYKENFDVLGEGPSSEVAQKHQGVKLHVSGNGKRHVRNFLAKVSLNVFVSYFLSCVERIIMHCSFKKASSFTLYCLIP